MSFSRSGSCLALGLRIAIGSDHDHRDVGSSRLGLRQQFKTSHPRHVDVGQDQDNGHIFRISNALKGHVAGLGKFHREATLAKVAPKMLTEQQLNVRFIINHEDEKFHG
jgi:hypothetical protein